MKSILFVPADRPKLFEKAAKSAASVVCLDLEDGVAPGNKANARRHISEAVQVLKNAGKQVAVRVNSDLELISDDFNFLTHDVSILVVPKAGSAHFLFEVQASLVRLFGAERDLIPLIESASDLTELERSTVLPASVTALCLGTEDFAADLGVSADSKMIESAFERLAILARRQSTQLFGYPGSIAEFQDLDKFSGWCRRGKAAGSVGGFAIHPAQVETLNDCFSLTEQERKNAKDIVEAFEAALAQGSGVISLHGRMIDRPVYLAALRMLSN